RLMYSGKKQHRRSYLVMVQNQVSEETLLLLQNGITIPTKAGEYYIAKPVSVSIINAPVEVYPFATDRREQYPHSWLLITLTEGKFRQVRKMVMAARHRCLRLIRISIGNLYIGNLYPGEVREMDEKSFFVAVGLDT
ncbi:MAG: pseudouridine synthase, partial [Ferruginibacter sp.]